MLKAVLRSPGRRTPARAASLLFALAFALAAWPAGAGAQDAGEPAGGEAIFTVFFRSAPVGVERVGVARTETGWRIASTGRTGPPVGLDIQSFEAEYDAEWRPRRLVIDSLRNDAPYRVRTQLADGTAASEIEQGDDRLTRSGPIAADAVLLPDFFFGAYEALAARLNGRREGDAIPVYVAPRREVTAVVQGVRRQPIRTARRQFSARVYRLAFDYGDLTLQSDVWVDERHRLLRVNLPDVHLDAARQDLALVSTRLTGVRHPGDADVRVPARGFSLAASVTTPPDREPPPDGWPAVLLVPGTGLVNRDENLGGVPIYGDLAAGLADAGYLVMRYDKRGIGQSGGRPESAAMDQYVEDVRTMVRHLDRRDDVDRERIVVVAHGEGSWIGLQAAARDDAIDALALLAAPGAPGAELVMEQQRNRLDRLEAPAGERERQIALQARIIDAVLRGGAWDDVPEPLRRRADTAWFRSFLEFEPADAVRRTRQPVLIVHGEADREISPQHADRLAALAEARRRRESTVEVVKLPGVDHRLLAVSTSGAEPEPEVDRYSQLLDAQVAPEVVAALSDWMERTVPAERR